MARPPKRRASSTLIAKRPETRATATYAPDREPPLKERLTLPKKFHTPYVWPVRRILAEKGGKYLVDWEKHPTTGEVWKPDWRPRKDVGDELIDDWEKRKRKAQAPVSSTAPIESLYVSKHRVKEPEEEGYSKRRRLTRRDNRLATTKESRYPDSDDTDIVRSPIIRKRPNRLVIRSLSPSTTEIQETQVQSLSNVDSIQVNVPSGTHINRDDYQTIPDSSASLHLPGSNHVSITSAKDQEADSALGLSSPIDEISARSAAAGVDQESYTASGVFTSSNSDSRDWAGSAETIPSHSSPRQSTTATRLNTKLFVSRNDPVEHTQGSPSVQESDHNHSTADSAASSPLFYPDTRENGYDSTTDGETLVISQSPGDGQPPHNCQSQDYHASTADDPSLAIGQPLGNSQLTSSARQQKDNALTFHTSADLVPIVTTPSQGEDNIVHGSISERSTTPKGKLGESVVPKGGSQASESSEPNVTEESTASRHSSAVAPEFKKPPITPPVRQLPRAKLFQKLNLRDKPQPSQRLIASMSSESRESSPRFRRSAPPPAERLAPTGLRETLVKQSTSARALQAARHSRGANQSSIRITSRTTNRTPSPAAANTFGNEQSYLGNDLSVANVTVSDQAHKRNGPSTNPPSSSIVNGFSPNDIQFDRSEPALVSTITPTASIYTTALGSSALPVQASIEDEQSIPEISRPTLPSCPILGPAEYVVPLPAEGKIKDHYLECIRGKRRSLERFTRNPKSTGRANMSRINAAEAEQMKQLIDRLNDTTTHLDLGLDGPGTQHNDSLGNEATWNYYASMKFAFLYHLIEALRDFDCCILVIAKDGQILDLLEKYMRANHVNYRRPPEFAAGEAYRLEDCKGLIRVDLLGSNAYLERKSTRTPSLIVAFDASFDPQNPEFEQMRAQLRTHQTPIPIIYPVIMNSAEHVDLCIPRSMPSPQRFQMLVQTTFRARESLGGEPIIIASPSLANSLNPMNAFTALKKSLAKRISYPAEAVARAAMSDNFDANWLISVPDLDLEPLSETSSEPVTVRSTTPRSRAGTPSAYKRFRDGESASSISSKRQRMTPAADITHISDSMRDSQSQIENLRQALRLVEDEAAREKKGRIAAELALAAKTKVLEETTLSLSELQKRYETRMKTSHQLKRDNKKLYDEKDAIEKRQEKLLADVALIRGHENQLKVDLAEAREALKMGGGPIAELEVSKEETRRLTEKNASLEKSAANMRKDFEFTRSQYQEASTKAAEFATQAVELESQNSGLRRQASDEKRKLREKNYGADLEQHLARVMELELLLKNRDFMLQKKEEELKALRKGRGVATRGSSVQPGSPRPAGSRGGSPAPGLLAPGTHAGSRASALRHER